MSRNPHDNALRGGAASYAESLGAPRPDVVAIRARAGKIEAARRESAPKKTRRTILTLAVAGLLVAATPSVPIIVAGVQRVIHAFIVVNGKVMQARTQHVTLAQARAHVAFQVIDPAPLPATFHASITEIDPSPNRAYAQVWFQYGNVPGPGLTIVETSPQSPWALAMQRGPGAPNSHGGAGVGQGMVVSQTIRSAHQVSGGAMITGSGPSMVTASGRVPCISVHRGPSGSDVRVRACSSPPLPRLAAGPGTKCVHTSRDGRVSDQCSGEIISRTGSGPGAALVRGGRIRVRHVARPSHWIVHGTLVVVIDPQGVLSAEQLRALRAGMAQ
jgi:hypothetical protein